MRRIIMQVYDVEDLPGFTMAVLEELQRKKIVSVVKIGGCIGVARCHVNRGRDSLFRRMVKQASIA